MSFYPCLLNPWKELKEQHLSAGATASLNRSPCLLLCSFQSSSLLKISFQPKKGNEKPNLWFHPAKQCKQIKVRSLMCPDWQFFATQSHDAELRVLLYFYLPLQTQEVTTLQYSWARQNSSCPPCLWLLQETSTPTASTTERREGERLDSSQLPASVLKQLAITSAVQMQPVPRLQGEPGHRWDPC